MQQSSDDGFRSAVLELESREVVTAFVASSKDESLMAPVSNLGGRNWSIRGARHRLGGERWHLGDKLSAGLHFSSSPAVEDCADFGITHGRQLRPLRQYRCAMV
jgi:hypothetical protein